MGKVIPKYKELEDRGQIELTTTPYYHPILPLLCDSDVARESMPYAKLPDIPFQHPEDAANQIRMAVEYHEKKFGRKPRGMWPSEGSVSEQIIPLIAEAGLKWIATDEAILEKSLQKSEGRGLTLSAQDLYQPYLAQKEGAPLAMIFRNHFVSDQLGFVYYRWQVEDAVEDFMCHMNNIRISLPEDGKNYLVSVILDGENAWEYYPGGGKAFLEAFYQRLSNDQLVKTTRVSDHLENNPPTRALQKLFAGSWINNDFKIWISHPEDNTAWDYLYRARLVLEGYNGENAQTAWQELYIAEGSDWCWWYGDDHSSENDAAFDSLFRKHLQNIYSLIGKPAPKELDSPIKRVGLIRPIKEPVYLIQPVLDGEITNYYEWLSSGYFDISKARGAMHQIETLLRDIYYGFSMTDLFIRLGANIPLASPEMADFSFAFITAQTPEKKLEISFDAEAKQHLLKFYRMGENQEWQYIKNLASFGVGRIIEMGISFADLEVKPGQTIDFTIVVCKDGQELERWPRGGSISVTAPTEAYEYEQWSV
jgi:alpha-amylase/alpha-mannosidase (GH57 family)